MRVPVAFAVIALTACEPGLAPLPPPDLVVRKSATPPPRLGTYFRPGEHMAWLVHAKGLTLGRAELTVAQRPDGDLDIETRFSPSPLVAALRSLRHDMQSSGKPKNGAHTLHSAIGWLRLWAQPKARPTHFALIHEGVKHRIALDAPQIEPGNERQIRVDGLATSTERQFRFTVWLSRDSDRSIESIRLRTSGRVVIATRIDDDT